MEGRVYVTHEPIKLTVTFGAPTRDKTRKVSDSSQEVETSHTGSVKTFHQNACGMFPHLTFIGELRAARAAVLVLSFLSHLFKISLKGVKVIDTLVDNGGGESMQTPRTLTTRTFGSRRPSRAILGILN